MEIFYKQVNLQSILKKVLITVCYDNTLKLNSNTNETYYTA